MKRAIPTEEVKFNPQSFQDPAGRIFTWNGGVYRGISAESAPFLARFVQSDTHAKLVAAGLLIDTEVTDLAIDGFDLVLRHRLLPFVSYPFEWSAAMLKAAALTIINLAIEVHAHGMMLKD